jgi:hypothetical protein
MKKLLKPLKNIFATGVFAFTAATAQAAIIDYGTYFSDTRSGLDWLDVTSSVNRSYNDIFSQLAPGGEFQGWRFATSTEFNSLLSDWTGMTPNAVGRTVTTGTIPSVDGLVMLFGSTLDSRWISTFGETWDSQRGFAEGEGIDFTLGILADSLNNTSNQRSVGSLWDNETNGAPIDFFHAHHRQVFLDETNNDIGAFLVRSIPNNGDNSSGPVTHVNEPASLILLLLGLSGIIAVRTRKH